MKKTLFLLNLLVLNQVSIAQSITLPGDSGLDNSYIKSGLTTLEFLMNSNDSFREIGTYEIEIKRSDEELTVNSTLYFKDSDKQWEDKCVVNATTLAPIRFASQRDELNYNLHFTNKLTGEFIDIKKEVKTAIDFSIKEKFYDINIIPHLLKTLPLKLGYKTILRVYDYEATDKTTTHKVLVNEVKSDVYESSITGSHDVWKVSVFEESTGHKYDYFIDKGNRRIWQIIIVSNKGQLMLLYDRESDYNPVKQEFDKTATKALITDGNSSIKGQVFGRANKNIESWVTVVNWNPKQVAKKGTSVFLIPFTEWHREYFEVNKQLKKEGRKFNMPKEVLECILVSDIYDDDGHFEFVNLMPGTYLIYSQFEFFENYVQDNVVGSRDHYMGNVYQGSSDILQRSRWSQKETAFSEEIVEISVNGEAKEIKLKKQNKSKVL